MPHVFVRWLTERLTIIWLQHEVASHQQKSCSMLCHTCSCADWRKGSPSYDYSTRQQVTNRSHVACYTTCVCAPIDGKDHCHDYSTRQQVTNRCPVACYTTCVCAPIDGKDLSVMTTAWGSESPTNVTQHAMPHMFVCWLRERQKWVTIVFEWQTPVTKKLQRW